MFLVKFFADPSRTETTILKLDPPPTEVDYPEGRAMNLRRSQDGQLIIQRPFRDDRVRKWVWVGYPKNHPAYENLWCILDSLEVRTRVDNNLHPYVDIYEDDSKEGGFGRLSSGTEPVGPTYANVIWTPVQFIHVHRETSKGGGFVRYDQSVVEFIITDPAWRGF